MFLRSSSKFFHILRISIHAHLKAQANLNLGGGFSELGLGQWHIFTFNIFSSCLHCHPSQFGWRFFWAWAWAMTYFQFWYFFFMFTLPPISIWVEVGEALPSACVWNIWQIFSLAMFFSSSNIYVSTHLNLGGGWSWLWGSWRVIDRKPNRLTQEPFSHHNDLQWSETQKHKIEKNGNKKITLPMTMRCNDKN